MTGNRKWIGGAIAVYFLLGFALIAQRPGLQYDEALLVAGAVHMEHSSAVFELESTPDAWVCPFDHCIPLMAFLYVGPMKEYASLPFFKIFGPRTSIIRLVSLTFGASAIWGVYLLIYPWFGRNAAALFAIALAINPAFLNMVVFDNSAIGAFMAGLGLACAGASIYATRKSTLAAFGFGAALGFGVWTRANFLWIVVAAAAAAIIVFRRRLLVPGPHIAALVVGGIVGGFPFLLYQIVSNGATWRAQAQFAVSQPMSALLRERTFLFADTLLSDGEHRKMWNGPPLPAWQLWLFPTVLLLACLACLSWRSRGEIQQRSLAQLLTLTLLFTGGILFFSRLPVGEHHLVILLPFAIAIVVLACSMLQKRLAHAWQFSALLFLIYASSCVYWQAKSLTGLSKSGGVDVWSNGENELVGYLERNVPNRQIKTLDWGLKYNLYVLSDGRIKPREIFSQVSEDVTDSGRPWVEEIREGGVFLLHGAENREFPKSSAGFLRALATARPVITRTHRIAQHDAVTYAHVVEIEPNSIRGPGPDNAQQIAEVHIPMDNSRLDGELSGFYPPEPGGFRWTRREFSARLDLSHLARPLTGGFELLMGFYIPENTLQKLGALTLQTRFGGHPLAPETCSRPGQYIFRRQLDDAWVAGSAIPVDFSLDKALPGTPSDNRELGIAVTEISVVPQ